MIPQYAVTYEHNSENVQLVRLNAEQRHRNMQNIRSKDTSIEIILRRALWKRGLRYRKNYAKLPGKPDIVFTKHRLAVFCDSEFFHGKDWEQLKELLRNGNNPEFWINKISKNIERDRKVEAELKILGWKVIRFWGKDIKKNTDECVNIIIDTMFS